MTLIKDFPNKPSRHSGWDLHFVSAGSNKTPDRHRKVGGSRSIFELVSANKNTKIETLFPSATNDSKRAVLRADLVHIQSW